MPDLQVSSELYIYLMVHGVFGFYWYLFVCIMSVSKVKYHGSVEIVLLTAGDLWAQIQSGE